MEDIAQSGIPESPATTPPQEQASRHDKRQDIVALFLVFFYPLGLILMWRWMKGWRTWVKILITLPILIALIEIAILIQFLIRFKTDRELMDKIDSTPKPTISSKQGFDNIANWKTYTNSTYSYSLQYPSNWYLYPNPGSYPGLVVFSDTQIDNTPPNPDTGNAIVITISWQSEPFLPIFLMMI